MMLPREAGSLLIALLVGACILLVCSHPGLFLAGKELSVNPTTPAIDGLCLGMTAQESDIVMRERGLTLLEPAGPLGICLYRNEGDYYLDEPMSCLVRFDSNQNLVYISGHPFTLDGHSFSGSETWDELESILGEPDGSFISSGKNSSYFYYEVLRLGVCVTEFGLGERITYPVLKFKLESDLGRLREGF